MASTLHEALSEAVKRLGKSTHDLSREVGYTQPAWSLWLRGKRRMPEAAQAKFCEVYGLKREFAFRE